MGDHTHIEWTDATWNPVTGCSVVSRGCKNCYAMKLAGGRLRNHPSRRGLVHGTGADAVWTGDVRFNDEWLAQPLEWRRPRRIFVCAHGDLFHANVPRSWILMVWAVMLCAPWHTFQVLTKRPQRMAEVLADPQFEADVLALARQIPPHYHCKPLPPAAITPQAVRHIQLGTSIEDQATADERLPYLLKTPTAYLRFISAEPLLGPVDLQRACTLRCPNGDCIKHGSGRRVVVDSENGGTLVECICSRLNGIYWVICGGESGQHGRPMHPDWARSLRDLCQAAGVPFFFKQWGVWGPVEQHPGVMGQCIGLDAHTSVIKLGKNNTGRLLDGQLHDAFPPDTPAPF